MTREDKWQHNIITNLNVSRDNYKYMYLRYTKSKNFCMCREGIIAKFNKTMIFFFIPFE